MENKNKVILIFIIILTLGIIGFCVYSIMNNNIRNNDAIKFRTEYMELNGKINENNNKVYVNVSLSEKNTFKYASEEEIVELLESGTGVIYFGFPTCPWCRSLLTTLGSVAEEKNETIYYLNVLDLRSTYEIQDEKLVKVKNGSKGYYKILSILGDHLSNYVLTDEDENKYETGEKRLYAPTLVAVKDGVVTKIHVGTVESQKSGYDKLSTEELKELEDIIESLIDSKNVESCNKGLC